MQPTAWQSPHGRPLPGPGGRTLVMGVLNVTPDSFSDGGQLPSAQAAVDRAGEMLAAGADVLDVGGESTRPGAAPVNAAEECDRILPALTALRQAFPAAAISVDTYKPAVARAGVRAGADIVNDIWGGLHGLTSDERRRGIEALERGETSSLPRSPMAAAVAALGCPLILM
ncbi:MAG: dihydropteroate synthase, partial [Opitutaceae bacterium]